jgi:putative hemolysin
LRIFGVKLEKDNGDEGFSKIDLDYLVSSSLNSAKDDGKIEDDMKIFHNALDFPDTKVRDCMVPRTEMNAVEENCSLDELMQMFIESGNSKIIVYKNDIDHIVGYIHSSEMFSDPASWHQRIRTMPFVPETMAAQKLMQLFLQQKKSLGVVVDEFGGTSGIVSLEDVVEEIFGDIEDEHDNNPFIAKKIENDTYILSARLEIDKVNEMFDLDLPESEDYMTVGGLILHEYKSFPKLNEVIEIGKFKFKIIKNTMKKIELVKLTVES